MKSCKKQLIKPTGRLFLLMGQMHETTLKNTIDLSRS